jgi:ACR3 family arsenite efflux pump ArsB
MGILERFLSLWVGLAILAGVALGSLFPNAAAAIEALQVARINLPIALLIWGMIVPMMLAVDFGAIASNGEGGLRRQPKGMIITVAVNWLIKPLTMTAIVSLIATVLLLFLVQADAILANPQAIAMIGASNFFELAVASSLFGLNSGAALATVVGVLVEVPVMLSLVAIANRNRFLVPFP